MGVPTYSASWAASTKPNLVTVSLTEAVIQSIDATGWIVTVNAGGNVITSLSTAKDSRIVSLALSVIIEKGDTVTVEYTGGGDILSTSTLEALAVFASQAVTNLVEAAIANGDPTSLTGAYNANGDVDLIYAAGNYGTVRYDDLKTPSLLRTELNINGLQFTDDRRGRWSIIQSARDSVLASL